MELWFDDVKITERGWVGHFICGDKCKFRRNTLLEYASRKWIVSTVGCMVTYDFDTKKNKVDTIGYNRWYETMIFEAKNKDGYIEADVEKEITIPCLDWGIWGKTWEEVKENYGHDVDNAANDMHDDVVAAACRAMKGELHYESNI